MYHEWLTGVLFYPVYKWTGETGLQLLRYAIILMTVSLVFLAAEKRGSKPIPTIIIFYWVAMIGAVSWRGIRTTWSSSI